LLPCRMRQDGTHGKPTRVFEQLVLVGYQTVEAVTRLNDSGLIHRDLKLDNVMVRLASPRLPLCCLCPACCCCREVTCKPALAPRLPLCCLCPACCCCCPGVTCKPALAPRPPLRCLCPACLLLLPWSHLQTNTLSHHRPASSLAPFC